MLFRSAYAGATRLQNEIEEIFKYLDVSDVFKPEFGAGVVAEILSVITTIQKNLELEEMKVFQKDRKSVV